jgi:hypothetical protein
MRKKRGNSGWMPKVLGGLIGICVIGAVGLGFQYRFHQKTRLIEGTLSDDDVLLRPSFYQKEVSQKEISFAKELSSSSLSPSTLPSLDLEGVSKQESKKAKTNKNEGPPCSAEEYPSWRLAELGDDEQRQAWETVHLSFQKSKGSLLAWLNHSQGHLGVKSQGLLSEKIAKAKLEIATHDHSPDLLWRGTGVLISDESGVPVIRLGRGFVLVAHYRPELASFEVMRLLSQVWAPFFLKRDEVGVFWGGGLDCFGEIALDSSKAGWAVSTALAASLSPSGCPIPALEVREVASCLANKSLRLENEIKEI